MAKEYRTTTMTRVIGRVMSWLARRGWGPATILTTVGRKTGTEHQVPVSPVELDGAEYLVAPYGAVGWVKNLRSQAQATLERGGEAVRITAHETTGEEAARVVAVYHAREGYARRYMDVPDDPDIADFLERIDHFPVFRVERPAATS
jgi:deazaflavin-dependent oxidoreductase (nitroreductase family)